MGRVKDKAGSFVEYQKSLLGDFESSTVNIKLDQVNFLPEYRANSTYIEVSKLLSTKLKKKIGAHYMHMGLLNVNPLWWHTNGSKIDTEIAIVDIFTENKTYSWLMGEEIEVFLKRMPWAENIITGMLTKIEARVYKFYVEPNTLLNVRFQYVSNDYFAYISR